MIIIILLNYSYQIKNRIILFMILFLTILFIYINKKATKYFLKNN